MTQVFSTLNIKILCTSSNNKEQSNATAFREQSLKPNLLMEHEFYLATNEYIFISVI